MRSVGFAKNQRSRYMQRSSARSRTARHFAREFPGVSGCDIRSALGQSPAQLHQDVFALCANEFSRDQFFLDIGASDGVTLSNSILLERSYGWSGIAIEPDPRAAKKFRRARNCVLVESAVSGSQSAGTARLVRAGMLSALSEDLPIDAHSAKRSNSRRSTEVQLTPLNEILERHAAPTRIDFLSLDIEGLEFDVLKSLDWQSWNVRAIAVEHNFRQSEALIESFLDGRGFRRVLTSLSDFDGWFVRK